MRKVLEKLREMFRANRHSAFSAKRDYVMDQPIVQPAIEPAPMPFEETSLLPPDENWAKTKDVDWLAEVYNLQVMEG